MAISSATSNSSLSSGAFSQLRQQQTLRSADQAEQQARALRAQAQSAQSQADRAQENARNLRVQSSQAQSEASSARQSALAQKSLGQVQTQLSDVRNQISTILKSESFSSEASAPTPVVNALGEQTGTLISVTA